MSTFKDFQNSRRYVPDLLAFSRASGFDFCAGLEDRAQPQAGYVYNDGSLFIEETRGSLYMLIGRCDWTRPVSQITELELELYSWACDEGYEEAATDSHEAALACLFVRALRCEIGSQSFDEMRALNHAAPFGPNVCHSHDYCDANSVMIDALNVIHPRDELSDDDFSFMERAWNMARPILGHKE